MSHTQEIREALEAEKRSERERIADELRKFADKQGDQDGWFGAIAEAIETDWSALNDPKAFANGPSRFEVQRELEEVKAEKQAAMDHAAAAVETAKRLEVENKALREAGQAVIEDCANLFGQRDTRAEDWANKLLVDLQYLRSLMKGE